MGAVPNSRVLVFVAVAGYREGSSQIIDELIATERKLLVAAAVIAAACTSVPRPSVVVVPQAAPIPADTLRVPLNDLGARTYRGFQGGLYPGGSNVVPTDHEAAGIARRNLVKPLDVNGIPSASGKYVLISIGMSNTTEEWCSISSAPPCDSWTFTGRSVSDASVNHSALVIVNGAAGGQDAAAWTSPAAANYDRIRDTRLAPLGLGEKQVQIAWVKIADARPSTVLPSASADAYTLLQRLGDVVRALKVRYPNLQQVFLSSRSYGGYATTDLNPEPYAYESGFSVKWLIESQIAQPRAPWIAWGPYFWADGINPRSDGLSWPPADFGADGTHPSQSGAGKAGAMLLEFFKSSPETRCWFLAGQSCS